MTLNQRLIQLQEEKRDKHIAHNFSREKDRVKARAGMDEDRKQQIVERANHIDNMVKGGALPSKVRETERRFKAKDLESVGFVSHMLALNDAVVFYLCENESLAYTIDQKLKTITAINPDADLYSYEQELHFFITRVEKPDINNESRFIPIGEDWTPDA